MFKLRRKKNILIKSIDQLNEILIKSNIQELSMIIGSKKEILIRNLIAGISKGIGIGIGFTVITAILLLILRQIVKLNIPVIGQFVADIINIVEQAK